MQEENHDRSAERTICRDDVDDYADRNSLLLNQLRDPVRHRQVYESLVSGNIKLVQNIARKFIGHVRHDLSYDDLISEGVIGLMKAIDKYDSGHNTAFSTYAVYWIRQSIVRAIYDKGTRVRVPVHLFELIVKIKREEARFWSRNDTCSKEQICEALGIHPDRYDRAKLVEHNFLSFPSLDQYVNPEEGVTELGEFASRQWHDMICFSEEFCDPALLAERQDIRDRIMEVINTRLTPREKNVISRRFGFITGSCETLEEIGQSFGVTRERIRQIERKAMMKLRSGIARNPIRDDFEWPDLISG